MALGKFINYLGRLFCFSRCGKNQPSHTHGDHTDENLPSSPLPPPRQLPKWITCGVHTGAATGPCTCGLDRIRDGSFNFHEMEEKFRAFLFNEGQSSREQSESDLFPKETEVSTDCTREEEDRIGDARFFSRDEIDEAIHSFDPVCKLGEGGYGSVYLGKLKDGQMVAVKTIHDHESIWWHMNEVTLFCSLRHQNLVRLNGCTSGSGELVLVYEYMSNGNVAEHLHGHRITGSGVLTWHLRMQIAIETAEGITYLHCHPDRLLQPGRQPIIHCDIKTDNILFDDTFHVKVGDFGLSTLYRSTRRGTLGYLDPEYNNDGMLTDKSDVYSFGVVLLELISGQKAVDVYRNEIYLESLAPNMIRNKELELLVDPNLEYQSDSEIRRMINKVAELACLCLQTERNKRPSMAEVLWNLKKIRDNKDPDIQYVDYSLPAESLTFGITFDPSKLVPLIRRGMEESGFIEFLEQVSSSSGHKLSTIVLFWSFKEPHLNAKTSCDCRQYFQNGRILEGLINSTCFFTETFFHIVNLAVFNEISIQVAQRIVDQVTQRVVDCMSTA